MTDSGPQDPYAGQPYQGYPGQPYQAQPQPGGPYGYPAYGYPPPHPGYPPPGYWYGQPPPYPPAGSGRPGLATASAVLAYVASGLLIVAGIVLFTGASVINDLNSDGALLGSNDVSSELAVDGVFNLIAAGLLLIGGVQLCGRKAVGSTLLYLGSGLTLAYSVYWIVRPENEPATIFWALLFAALVIIAASMALATRTRAWLAATPAPPATPAY